MTNLADLVDPVFYEDDRQYAQLMWRRLTGPQRELPLSAAADAPVAPHPEVRRRLVALGLITADLTVTEAGRTVVQCR